MLVHSDEHSVLFFCFFSSRRRHTRLVSDWSSDVCSTNLVCRLLLEIGRAHVCTLVTDQARMTSCVCEQERVDSKSTLCIVAEHWSVPLLKLLMLLIDSSA